jgi:hypothetical protein
LFNQSLGGSGWVNELAFMQAGQLRTVEVGKGVVRAM